MESVLDLGCGEGQVLLMLRELTNIKDYYGYDLSKTFIDNLICRWGNVPGLTVQEGNFTTIDDFPTTDMCICMGVALYVLDDKIMKNTLSNLNSKIFICRVPCSMNDRVEINKPSKEFGANYAAVYRTIPEYIDMLSESFEIKSIDRCYPDDIESEHGTKQFSFVCKRK